MLCARTPLRPPSASALLLVLLSACGGPLGVPVDSQGADDTAGPVVPGLGGLAGVVLDADGEPLADAVLTTLPRGYQARSAADGAWAIGLLPPDSYQLVVAAEGWEPLTTAPVEVEAEEVATVEARLVQPTEPGGRVEVEVLGPDGLPLAGAVVTVSDGSSGVTGADGTVVLSGVTGEDLVITAADGAGRGWPRTLRLSAPLTEAGGVQWQATLSGRPAEGSASVGSAACSICHATEAERHAASMHGQALAGADELGDPLLAAFTAGTTVDLGAAAATLTLEGATPTVTLVDSTGASRSYAVAGTIGSPSAEAVPWTDLGEQGYPLPVGWKAADGARPADYPDAQARLVPYEVSRWFDEDGRFAFAGAAPDPATSAEAQCLACHSNGWTLTARTDGGLDMVSNGPSGRWIDAFVGCEQCHGNGESHIAATEEQRLWTITKPELLDTDRSNEVCAHCHSQGQALDSDLPYPFTRERGWFEPGAVLADYLEPTPALWPSGAAAAGRSQADELALSPHGPGGLWEMRCLDCHDPHADSAGADGQPLPSSLRLDARDNTMCLSCHQGLDFEGILELAQDHTGHGYYGPDGVTEDGRCTACHMPGTAADLAHSTSSGAGDLSSHLFEALPPQDTLDWFDDLGAGSLPVGSFPIHGCADCHALNDWLFDGRFPGPHGEPTLRETHQGYQDSFVEMYP